MRRYSNFYKVYSMSPLQLMMFNGYLSFLIWRRRGVNQTRRTAHWIGRYPERVKIVIRIWRWRFILWLSLDSVTE